MKQYHTDPLLNAFMTIKEEGPKDTLVGICANAADVLIANMQDELVMAPYNFNWETTGKAFPIVRLRAGKWEGVEGKARYALLDKFIEVRKQQLGENDDQG